MWFKGSLGAKPPRDKGPALFPNPIPHAGAATLHLLNLVQALLLLQQRLLPLLLWWSLLSSFSLLLLLLWLLLSLLLRDISGFNGPPKFAPYFV